MASELVAYCGLYCGACSFRLAAEENDRGHLLAMPSCYDHLKAGPMEYCPGCRLENKCGECAIRDCAVAKGIACCSECDAVPCAKVEAFSKDGKPHHAEVVSSLSLLRKLGENKWLEEMRTRWTCRCGARISWYYRSCRCALQGQG